MEDSIPQLDEILLKLTKINSNFRRCNRFTKTKKHAETRIAKLLNLKEEYENIYKEKSTIINGNQILKEVYHKICKLHNETLVLVQNFLGVDIQPQEEVGYGFLIETVLTYLKSNLNSNEYNNIQILIEHFKAEETTDAEILENLLDNVLTYYTKKENILILEIKNLTSKLDSQRSLTNKLLDESDNFDTESHDQTELVKELEKERERLHTKIHKLESDLKAAYEDRQDKIPLDTETNDESNKEQERIAELTKLLGDSQVLHEHTINILQKDKRELGQIIVELKLKEANLKTNKMPETLQDITKQINNAVPIFSGEKNRHLVNDLNIFLDTCRMVHDGLSADGKIIFLKYIRTRCRGDAYDLVTRRKFEDFEGLTKILTDTYLPIKSVRDFKEELHRCNQRPGETLMEYADRLKRVVWDCIRCIEDKYKENNGAYIKEMEVEAIDVFRAGVNNPSVRNYLLTIKSEELEKVISEAIYFERVDNRYRKADERDTQGSSQTHIENPPKQQIQAYQYTPFYQIPQQIQYAPNYQVPQQIQTRSYQPKFHLQQHGNINTNNGTFYQSRPNGTQARQFNGYRRNFNGITNQSPVTCQYCGKPGHSIEACRRRAHTCPICGQMGHFASDCRNGEAQTSHGTHCIFCKRTDHEIPQCQFKRQWEEHCRNEAGNQGSTQNQGN